MDPPSNPSQGHSVRSKEYVIKSMIAGGIAGCAAKTLIAPLDRVKILFQTNNPIYQSYSGSFLGVFRALKVIKQEYGVLALFQGHSATLVRIFPYAAIKFMSYEQYKALIMPTKDKQTSGNRFIAGSLAGMTSLFISYPLDIIRVRMAFEVKSNRELPSIIQTCKIVYSEKGPFFQNNRVMNGVSSFYRGFCPTLYGMIPYAGVSFLTYETLKEMASSLQSPSNDSASLGILVQLMVGGVSGALAQTCSYPFEIIRRRMQVQGLNNLSRTTLQTAKFVYSTRGFKGFWVGLSIGYIKVIPMFAVSFYVYEAMKKAMDI